MPIDFLLASCPAPLARVTYTAPSNTSNPNTPSTASSITRLEIAPKKIWGKPFYAWLNQPATINRIIDTIDPFAAHVDTWAELIEARVGGEAIAHDAGFRAWIDVFATNPVIGDAETDTAKADTTDANTTGTDTNTQNYEQRAIREIADTFFEAAHAAFVTYASYGAIHKREYTTGGMSWGDAPTEHFDDVKLLNQVDFFVEFPIADIEVHNGDIAHSTVTAWRDHDGNTVVAPSTTVPTATTP